MAGVLGEAVLPSLTLLIVDHLARRRLPNIDDGSPAQVLLRNFRIHFFSSDSAVHGSTTALKSRSAKATASSHCLPSGNTIGLLSQKSRFICDVPSVFLVAFESSDRTFLSDALPRSDLECKLLSMTTDRPRPQPMLTEAQS